MKKAKQFGLIILSFVALAGCATKNPNYNPALPPTQLTGTNPPFIPATNSISNIAGTAHTVNDATAPADPYAPLVDKGIDLVAGIATVLSLAFAKRKNNQAVTANAAAAHLATVLPDNMVAQAVNSAPNQAVAAAVAAHLSAAPDTGVVATNVKS